MHICLFPLKNKVESHLEIHRSKNFNLIPRSTTTISQAPTETEYYNESVPGNDVLSTPLGIPRQPPPQQRTDNPASAYTTTHSSTVTARIRHPHPHPDENGHRNHNNNNNNNKNPYSHAGGRNGGGRHGSVTDESLQLPPRVGPSHDLSTSVSTIGNREITTSEELTTITTTTGRTEPATTTQPPSTPQLSKHLF